MLGDVNGQGQLGDGTATQRTTFATISGMTDVAGAVAFSDATPRGCSLVRHTTKNVSGAGFNGTGTLGLGDTTNRSSFQSIAALAGVCEELVLFGLNAAARIAAASVGCRRRPISPSAVWKTSTA
jgi:hypothetical protein